MNKADFVAGIAEASGLTKKDAEAALKGFTSTLTKCLSEDDKVTLPDLGTFKVATRAERTGKNPKTGEAITIAATKNAKFTAAKAMKDALNK